MVRSQMETQKLFLVIIINYVKFYKVLSCIFLWFNWKWITKTEITTNLNYHYDLYELNLETRITSWATIISLIQFKSR